MMNSEKLQFVINASTIWRKIIQNRLDLDANVTRALGKHYYSGWEKRATVGEKDKNRWGRKGSFISRDNVGQHLSFSHISNAWIATTSYTVHTRDETFRLDVARGRRLLEYLWRPTICIRAGRIFIDPLCLPCRRCRASGFDLFGGNGDIYS